MMMGQRVQESIEGEWVKLGWPDSMCSVQSGLHLSVGVPFMAAPYMTDWIQDTRKQEATSQSIAAVEMSGKKVHFWKGESAGGRKLDTFVTAQTERQREMSKHD